MIFTKLGRRRVNDARPPLRSITFKVDRDTAQALEVLEKELGGAKVRGRTSVILRKLILDAYSKIVS